MAEIVLIRKTAQSASSSCPALYEHGDEYIVVGKTITDPATMARLQAGVGDDETAVRVPVDTLAEVRQAD